MYVKKFEIVTVRFDNSGKEYDYVVPPRLINQNIIGKTGIVTPCGEMKLVQIVGSKYIELRSDIKYKYLLAIIDEYPKIT